MNGTDHNHPASERSTRWWFALMSGAALLVAGVPSFINGGIPSPVLTGPLLGEGTPLGTAMRAGFFTLAAITFAAAVMSPLRSVLASPAEADARADDDAAA